MQFLSRAHKEMGICYQESVFLFLCWRGVSWAPGKRAEPDEVWTTWEILQERELHIGIASLVKGALLCPRLGWSLRRKGMLCYARCDGESRTASGKRPETEQLVQQKGEASCLLLHRSPGQAEWCCCVTQPCVPNEPRLPETPWLWVVSEQSTCPCDTKEINSAVSLSQESHALTVLESSSGTNKWDGVAEEGTGVPAFLLQRQFLPLQDEVRINPGRWYITRNARGG